MPQRANLTASASVDFPLPRAPMIQVRPRGIFTLRPGRNPPLISIFSTTHMCSPSAGAGQAVYPPIQSFPVKTESAATLLYTRSWFVLLQNRPLSQMFRSRKRLTTLQQHPDFFLAPTPNGRESNTAPWTALTEMWPLTRFRLPAINAEVFTSHSVV